MLSRVSQPLRWPVLLLFAAGLAGANPVRAQDDGLFDRLFGTDPAAERSGKAADGLALPALFADGKLIADTLPVQDLGPGKGLCVTILPLLDALELAHREDGPGAGITITLPEPSREVSLPAAALLPSPSGDCVMLVEVPRYLPLSLTHDPVSQRLLLDPRAPLPVLMRLARAERQARLQPEIAQPAYPLLAPPGGAAQLWSADLSASLGQTAQGTRLSGGVLASGALFGLAGRASLALSGEGRLNPGFTLSDARDTADLLGPLHARSLALGDVAAPGQPLIADAVAGRGLVISSRAPWRADLVDEISLSGPLPEGWEAELWHEERLVAATRTPDSAGNWQFGSIPLRLGENRWVVRLYGPHGETQEQVYHRLVGAAMNAENEVDYAVGLVDGGRSLLGGVQGSEPAGPTAYATVDWGVTPSLTARADIRAALGHAPALALGLNGSHGGTLWSATAGRDRSGSLGGAVRIARKLGSQDVVFDLARHGDDAGPGLPPLVREFRTVASLSGQGRIGFGRLSLPWQARMQSGTLRSGDQRRAIAARLIVPQADWQASLALGAVAEGSAPWQATAALALTASRNGWRLRSGLDAAAHGGSWRLTGATFSAARTLGKGALALDLDWQADSGRFGGGLSYSRQLGPFGLSAGIGRDGAGWRAGIGLTLGLWRAGRADADRNGGGGWHAASAGVARSGAILAELFVDENGDGMRGADESAVAGGRFIVGAALRREETGSDGRVLIRGIAPGPAVDIETQLSSLEDFSLRPEHAGERIALRPGEVRRVAVPLRPTGSVEVRVVLVAGDRQTPRADVPVILRDPAGREVARALSDFDGYALFEGLAFGQWQAEAAGQNAPPVTLSRSEPECRVRVLVPPAG